MAELLPSWETNGDGEKHPPEACRFELLDARLDAEAVFTCLRKWPSLGVPGEEPVVIASDWKSALEEHFASLNFKRNINL
jgi:hypothetical protein